MKKPTIHFKKEGMMCSRCMMNGIDADLCTNCTKPFNIGTPLCPDCPLQGILLKNSISILQDVKKSFANMFKQTQDTIDELNKCFNDFMKEYEN